MSHKARLLGWSSPMFRDARVVFANVPDASSQKEVNQRVIFSSYLICRVSCCDRNNNITASPLHAKMTARATRLTYTVPSMGCPPTDLPPTALQPWLAERGAARRASARRRQVRPAAVRRSARAEQSQDDAMTPAGPTDTTPAPSRASSCACVADVASHLRGAG
eukprot:scaffold46942_cov99-Phaeocystis_antarctica.AAC.1